MPTRTEQGDLLFLIHASQGEFPRAVLAPGTIEQSFRAGWRAFNLAEGYQTPVLVLSDHYLAVAYRTVETDALDFSEVEIDRGDLLTDDQLDGLLEPYLRFRDTESGVSPRALPGHPSAVWVTTANEHDETGAIDETAQNRATQVQKRARKQPGLAGEIEPPSEYGPKEAKVALIGWGSTYGPLREAVDRLNADRPGYARMVHFSDLFPFPAAAAHEAVEGAARTIIVEGNATGQLQTLLRSESSITVGGSIRRYDGRSFTPEYILRGLREVA
jgi:2-oxoglutarate ferredoxin oxidoreductase subunit alpha